MANWQMSHRMPTTGEKATEELWARVHKYTIEKHEGLWRFYHNKRKIPVSKVAQYQINDKNLKEKKVFIKQYSPESGKKPEIIQKEYSRKTMLEFDWEWDEQNHWCYDDKTGHVYRWQLENPRIGNVWKEKKMCGSVPAGTPPEKVLAQILDRDITVNDAYDSQAKHRHLPKEDWKQVKWCREFDGKSIVALCIIKDKMTFAEIKNVIINEGGSIDPDGTIHRDN